MGPRSVKGGHVVFNPFAYRAVFTLYSGSKDYPPIRIAVKLDENMAKILMATPIKTIDVMVQRAGGIIIDRTPEPLEFRDGGNKPK